MINILAVFIGGGIGAVLRFLIGLIAKGTIFGTLGANLVGCFLIGIIAGFLSTKTGEINPALKLFLMTGFLGGLTTFSTFSLEAFEMIKAGNVFGALGYIALSLVLGLIFVYLGYSLNQL